MHFITIRESHLDCDGVICIWHFCGGFDARIALAEPLFGAVAAYAGYRGIYSQTAARISHFFDSIKQRPNSLHFAIERMLQLMPQAIVQQGDRCQSMDKIRSNQNLGGEAFLVVLNAKKRWISPFHLIQSFTYGRGGIRTPDTVVRSHVL